jgi:hypothetical protein
MDVAPGLMIQQSLNYIDPQIIFTDYGPYQFAIPNLLIPQNGQQLIGVDTITRYRLTMTGAWRLAGDTTTNKTKADAYLQPVQYGNKYFEQGFSYSSQELDRQSFAASNRNGGPLLDITQIKRQAVEEGWYQKLDQLLSIGLPRIGIFGLLNHPDASRISMPAMGAGISADNNLAGLQLLQTTIETNSTAAGIVHTPDTYLLPTALYNFLNTQLIGTSGTVSVLGYWEQQNPNIDVIKCPKATTAGTSGNAVVVAYQRDPICLEGIIPKQMTQVGGVVQNGSSFEVNYDGSVSGVHIKKTKSVLIGEF